MSILIGGAIATVVVVGYVGRKGWLAFHRAVGITPGTFIYTDPAQLPPPVMIQLQLTDEQLQQLPPVIIEQLTRIDNKADIYQTWKSELEQSGQTPATSEDEFIVTKLLNIRLPEMIDSYQRIARHEQRLNDMASNGNGSPSLNLASGHSKAHNEAVIVLMQLLHQTETKLDRLLDNYKSASLQDMQVMRRYLDDR